MYTFDTYCKHLLHFEGTNNSTTITDNVVGKTWSNTNTIITDATTVGSGFDKCAYFSSTSGIYTPFNDDLNLGATDFTIDMWIKTAQTIASHGTYVTLVCRDSDNWASNGDWNLCINAVANGDISFGTKQSGKIVDIAGGYTNTNAWVHVALVRYGNVYTIYINGTNRGRTTVANTIADLTSPMYVGKDPSYGRNFVGYMDEFNFTKGLALWQNDFTPPTSKYSIAGISPYTSTRRDRLAK